MEITESKNTLTEINTLWMGSVVQWRWQRTESVNVKTQQNLTNLSNRENRLNTHEQILKTCGTLIKELTFVSSESQKERRKETKIERVFKKIAKNSPKLAKETNVQTQETEQTPNRINPRKSIAKQIIINLLQTKDKKKSGEQPEKNNALSLEEHSLNDSGFLI